MCYGPYRILEPPPDLNQDCLEPRIQIETLQADGHRHPLIECLLIVLRADAEFGFGAASGPEVSARISRHKSVRETGPAGNPRTQSRCSGLGRFEDKRGVKIGRRLAIPANGGFDITIAIGQRPAQVQSARYPSARPSHRSYSEATGQSIAANSRRRDSPNMRSCACAGPGGFQTHSRWYCRRCR